MKRERTKATIRSLRPGDPIPSGIPRRYKNASGYIRLRWLVGTQEYVEAYEHRVVVGNPAGMHVHHIDRDKSNNNPSNLQVIDATQHGHTHARRVRRRKRNARRNLRGFDRSEAARLYAKGMGTVAIGELLGVDPSNISRGLRAHGVKMRTPWEARRAS